MKDIVLGWQMNPYSGWGVVGINLFTQLARDPDFRPISRIPIEYGQFMGMDPLSMSRIIPSCDASNRCTDFSGIVIDPVGNDLEGHYEADLTIGRVIIERSDLTKAQEKLSRFDALLTASTWNKQLLEDATGRTVQCINEGIDESLFFPGPEIEHQHFTIYSAGKVEMRKGQDLVLKAFKVFSERHADARLVTLWQSPYNEGANGFQGTLERPLWLDSEGRLSVKAWAHDNGIDPEKVTDLPQTPNFLIPAILRQCDVMLSPTRVESCTCLPVKESMACGLPVIAARHTGMLDIPEGMMWDLKRFTDIPKHTHWCEPDLEEIVEGLERLHEQTQERRSMGLAGSEWVRRERGWKEHTGALAAWIRTL